MMRVHYWLPPFAPMAAITLFARVFAKRSISQLDLDHEAVHCAQQTRDGMSRFLFRYVFSPTWRVRYEAAAYAVQARAGCVIDGDHGLAAVLAGPLYLWPCSREVAAAAIREAM